MPQALGSGIFCRSRCFNRQIRSSADFVFLFAGKWLGEALWRLIFVLLPDIKELGTCRFTGHSWYWSSVFWADELRVSALMASRTRRNMYVELFCPKVSMSVEMMWRAFNDRMCFFAINAGDISSCPVSSSKKRVPTWNSTSWLPLRKQQARLYRQIQGLHSVAHFWLRQHVFPVPRGRGLESDSAVLRMDRELFLIPFLSFIVWNTIPVQNPLSSTGSIHLQGLSWGYFVLGGMHLTSFDVFQCISCIQSISINDVAYHGPEQELHPTLQRNHSVLSQVTMNFHPLKISASDLA